MSQVTTINADFLVQNLQHFLLNALCITEHHHKEPQENIMLGDNGDQSIITGDLCSVINLPFKMNQRKQEAHILQSHRATNSRALFCLQVQINQLGICACAKIVTEPLAQMGIIVSEIFEA